ncbi:MAG TPA: hypothetical protein VNK95_09240 [Caldilineaceae bacterium]|nr:hypothetical protein [Caldilineaceae bacterium]
MLTPKKRYSWLDQNRAATLPGWRDFERVMVVVFDGQTGEDKRIYDVWLPASTRPGVFYGISCKMRNELRKAEKKGRAYIELTNANEALWSAVKSESGLDENNYATKPELVGRAIVELVESWHSRVDLRRSGMYDGSRSCYLNLLYDPKSGRYQLFQFQINLPDPTLLTWTVRDARKPGRATIVAYDASDVVFEWFPFSGGQFKYYPLVEQATWRSPVFTLEPLPADLEHIAINKAATYFPHLWSNLQLDAYDAADYAD